MKPSRRVSTKLRAIHMAHDSASTLRVNAKVRHGSAPLEVRFAHLYQVTIGVTDVRANVAAVVLRLCEKFFALGLPLSI